MLPLPSAERPPKHAQTLQNFRQLRHLGHRPSGAGKHAGHKEPFVEHKQSLRENFPAGRRRLAPSPKHRWAAVPLKCSQGGGRAGPQRPVRQSQAPQSQAYESTSGFMLLHVGLGGKRRSPTPVVHSTHPGQTPTPSWNELKTVGWGLTLHTRALPHFLETA